MFKITPKHLAHRITTHSQTQQYVTFVACYETSVSVCLVLPYAVYGLSMFSKPWGRASVRHIPKVLSLVELKVLLSEQQSLLPLL
jgi:hypothetical protein